MKKIGFCFLCKDDIHQMSLWTDFFKDNYDKCNIYIHCYNKESVTQDFTKKYHIDKVLPSGWGDIYDVVQYVMKLSIKNDDYKLVLLSESTIPVKPFNYVYDYLIYDTNGFLNYTPHNSENKNTLEIQEERYKNNANKISEFSEKISKEYWFFHEAWVIFNQEMMNIISNEKDYIDLFRKCFCPDENYVIFILSSLNKLVLFHNIKTTHTNWNVEKEIDGKRHPKMYDKISDNKLMKDLINPNLLFARKFTKDSNIKEYLPYLYSLYKDKPNLIWNRCNIIFKSLKEEITLDENYLFSYLSDNNINKYPIYDKVYHLLESSFTNKLNDKLTMGIILQDDNNMITPQIYTSSEELLKNDYDKDKIWFLKYRFGCCGRHILLKTTQDLRSIEISPRFIIQEGITNLDLYEGYKYTLRVFTLLHDKKFYLYRGLKKRVHNEKYDKKELNYSAQVCGSNYSERIPLYLDKDESLFKNLKEHSLLVKEKLKDIIDETDKFKYLLIGNDYLVKEDKRVILIEMKPLPDLVNNEEVNKKINIPLMKETINLVMNNQIDNYELITE